MNDQITLDHPSCHPVKGWFRASGEWEASPDVTIYLTATGRGNGIGIDWDFEVSMIELYDLADLDWAEITPTEKHVASVYCAENVNLLWSNASVGVNWTTELPTPLSETAKFWMLGIAYCWAMKSAGDWANNNAEPIPSPTPNED